MNYISKVNNLLFGSFVGGFFLGCVPNKISINFENKKIHVPIPLMTGFLSTSTVILSPYLFVNYFCNGTKLDRIIDKYDISVERYHQYDGKNNKYAYPTYLVLNITSKK